MSRKKYTRTEIRRALRKVRTRLLNGTITDKQFEMETVLSCRTIHGSNGPVCGTVACIGGHMAIILDPKVKFRQKKSDECLPYRGLDVDSMMSLAVEEMPNLHGLFFDWSTRPTRRNAAAAITRALDGKEDPWNANRAFRRS